MTPGTDDLTSWPDPVYIDVPPPPTDPITITVRIELDDVTPTVWRRVDVRGDTHLDLFNDILVAAMGWLGGHQHQFAPGTGPGAFLTAWDVDEGEEGTAETEIRLDQVLTKAGDRLFDAYDFGDGWQHTVSAERLRPTTADGPLAICLEGQNACPLEDCGGPGGHAEIVTALTKDPSGATLPERFVGWVPNDYVPRHFDVEEANQRLAIVAQSPRGQLGTAIFDDSAPRAAALDELLGRLDAGARDALLVVAAVAQNHAGSDPEVVARPWQLLLDLIGDDGQPLSAAGWMKPAAVRQLAEDSGLTTSGRWYGQMNREEHARPITDLRESARAGGLIRRHKNRLLLTKAGQAARGNPDAILRAVGGGFLAQRLDPVTVHARVLYLLHIAAGFTDRQAQQETAVWLTEIGWRIDDGDPLTDRDAFDEVHEMWLVLPWGDSGSSQICREFGDGAKLLARRALWPDG